MVWVLKIAVIRWMNVWMEWRWVTEVTVLDIRNLLRRIHFLRHFQLLGYFHLFGSLLSNLWCLLGHILLHRLFNLHTGASCHIRIGSVNLGSCLLLVYF